MAFKVIVKPLAEFEIDVAVNWYEEQKKNLGKIFLQRLTSAIKLVSENPHSFQKRYKNIRAFSLNKFPFRVYYIIQKDTLYIVAVLHEKRSLKQLKKRRQ